MSSSSLANGQANQPIYKTFATFSHAIPSGYSISVQEWMARKQKKGVAVFQQIIKKNEHNKSILLNQDNWGVIIDSIHQNSPVPLESFLSLLSHELQSDEPIIQTKNFSQFFGAISFLQALGFHKGIVDDSLAMFYKDYDVINTAMFALRNKITINNMYIGLNALWAVGMSYIEKNKVLKKQKRHHILSSYNFALHYNQYCDILGKLLPIGQIDVQSHDDLAMQILVKMGFSVKNVQILKNDQKVVAAMLRIYYGFAQIELKKKQMKTMRFSDEPDYTPNEPFVFAESKNKHIPSNCSISIEGTKQRKKNGVKRFEQIIKHKNKKRMLLKQGNWCIIIDAICQNGTKAHKKMRETIGKFNLHANKIHAATTNSKINSVGMQAVLQGLGFEHGIIENHLVLEQSNFRIIDTAIATIRSKLTILNMYVTLNTIWRMVMASLLQLDNKEIKRQKVKDLMAYDFLMNYEQYYDVLHKLLPIKYASQEELAVNVLIAMQLNVKQLKDENCVKLIGEMYKHVRKIELFKQKIGLNDYFRPNMSEMEEKYDSGHDDKLSAEYSLSVNDMNKRRLTGIVHFDSILMNKSQNERSNQLLDGNNWEILIDAIHSKMNTNKVQKSLAGLKTICQKVTADDAYRIMNIADTHRKTPGVIQFFKGLGFKDDIIDDKWVISEENAMIIQVCLNTLLFKISIFDKLQTVQTHWSHMVNLMPYNEAFMTNMEQITKLNQMNPIKKYAHYYDILNKAANIKGQRVSMELLHEFGFNVTLKNDQSTLEIMQCLNEIYRKIKEIESLKKQRVISLKEIAPSILRRVTTKIHFKKQNTPRNLNLMPQPGNQPIMQNILEFGQKWNEKNDSVSRQFISDQELSDLYDIEDWQSDLREAMYTKIFEYSSEMQASQFQLQEYLEYIQHFQSAKQEMKARKCMDPNCKWNANTVKLFMLSQRQIVHVMFYHTEDYDKIATSEMRANRFRQKVRTGKNEMRSLRAREAPPLSPKSSMTLNASDMMVIADEIEQKTQIVQEVNECKQGNECNYLRALLAQCRLVDGKKQLKANIDNNLIDHCLEYHADCRKECQNGSKCINLFVPKPNENYKIRSHSKLIQLHLHFYHNIQIDDEKGSNGKKKRAETMNQEKIEYLDAQSDNEDDDNQSFGKIEFGKPFMISQKSDARFKNPKEEMLRNTYHHLQKSEWNELLRKCVCVSNMREAKVRRLSMKQIASLKLYTDHDELQREFRICFREKDISSRAKRQRQFFWWNKMLVNICRNSKESISVKLYHGLNDEKLQASTFEGTYYGPVSTTTDYSVARSFAGDNGQVIELYPSFGAKGSSVNWLSNFPDENEVLFMNVSFQISDIIKINDELKLPQVDDLKEEESQEMDDLKENISVEQSIMNAMRTINTNSEILSLNERVHDKKKQNDDSNFSELQNYEKLSVLYLLYLQYKPKEWKRLITKANQEHLAHAFMKFRSQFITLAKNVKAVSMDNMSKLLQTFFYSQSSEYTLPILNKDRDFRAIYKNLELNFKSKQPFYFSIIVKLFPSAQQIAISEDNFDWTLKRFVDFLSLYDFDFHQIALQDVYIRGIHKQTASQNLVIHKARENMYKLNKLGWTFKTSLHLHRIGCEPLRELPFLLAFFDYNKQQRKLSMQRKMSQKSLKLLKDKKESALNLFRTPTMLLHGDLSHETSGESEGVHSPPPVLNDLPKFPNRKTMQLDMIDEKKSEDEDLDEKDESDDDDLDDEGSKEFVFIDHNPKNCILSKELFDSLSYKSKLIEMLKWRKFEWFKKIINYDSEPSGVINEDRLKYKFVNGCEKVESLVLNPLPKELVSIFCEGKQSKHNKANISFEIVTNIFPNISDLFLKETTFNLKECYKFINFIQSKPQKNELRFQRVFYSTKKPIKDKDVSKVKLRLKEIGWNFVKSQQMIIKMKIKR